MNRTFAARLLAVMLSFFVTLIFVSVSPASAEEIPPETPPAQPPTPVDDYITIQQGVEGRLDPTRNDQPSDDDPDGLMWWGFAGKPDKSIAYVGYDQPKVEINPTTTTKVRYFTVLYRVANAYGSAIGTIHVTVKPLKKVRVVKRGNRVVRICNANPWYAEISLGKNYRNRDAWTTVGAEKCKRYKVPKRAIARDGKVRWEADINTPIRGWALIGHGALRVR